MADAPPSGMNAGSPVGSDRATDFAARDSFVAVTTVWRLHEAVIETRRGAGKWFIGPNARRALREAQHAESVALRRLGFDDFEAFAAAHPHPSAAAASAVAPDATTTRITQVLESMGVDPGADPVATASEFLATVEREEGAGEEEGEGEDIELDVELLEEEGEAQEESRIEDLAGEIDKLREQVAELEGLLEASTAELGAVRAQLQPARQKAEQLEATIAALEESVRLRARERDDARAALERERSERAVSLDALLQLEATANELRSEIATTEKELRALREVAHADAEQLLHHTVGETTRMREEADATARDILAQAEREADLIRREAHVTAHGIREIAREDAKQIKATVEVFGATSNLPERIGRLERTLKKHRKALQQAPKKGKKRT